MIIWPKTCSSLVLTGGARSLGEAVNQLSKVAPDLAAKLHELPRMLAFRNMLIHGYTVIDPRIVWGVVEGQVPKLEEQLAQLLQ